MKSDSICIKGASEHNLKNIDLDIPRGKITVVTGVSGSGKSSLAFDTVLAESHRRFFYTLSNYSRQFLDLGTRPKVSSITGLSPAISLEQNETMPSRRSTVASITDIGELFGVLFARFGERKCPEHGHSTTPTTKEEVISRLLRDHSGQLLAITAPIVENKKGVFKSQLSQGFSKGCVRAFIDGKVTALDPIPSLSKEKKHTVKLICDYVKVNQKNLNRLAQALDLALALNNDYCEIFTSSQSDGSLDMDSKVGISMSAGCSQCGYSWPHLDSRHFSANSLGRCTHCAGYGQPASLVEEESLEADEDLGSECTICEICEGTGLNSKFDAIQVDQRSLRSMYQMSLEQLSVFLGELSKKRVDKNEAFTRVLHKITTIVDQLLEVGLQYIHLGRRILTLSGGESQRLKLAGILSEKLRGVLYVLDEPSQGLHPAELEKIWESIENLKANGNTVIIVDHDDVFIKKADLVIDLGPGGGRDGGNIQAIFPPSQIKKYVDVSPTARAICAHDSAPLKQANKSQVGRKESFLTLKNVTFNNLKISDVNFKLAALNVVTGVSGAGKTSLVFGVLAANLLESAPYVEQGYEIEDDWYHADKILGYQQISTVRIINRKPIAKSSVSMPATYLDCFKYLRDLYAKLPDAQVYGITSKHFSFASDLGRCPECKGRGMVTLSMRFLADVKETCAVCDGKRYQEEVLAVRYNGYSLNDVLDLTIEEVYENFKHHRQLEKKLRPAIDLGLGYLQFGQPSSTLSGGEAQRLKIVPLLSKVWGNNALLIIDEPTRGLHFSDVNYLYRSLQKLVNQGTTVVLVEHNTAIIKNADWVVDLGPGSGADGGRLVFEGKPQDLVKNKNSLTGKFIKKTIPC